MYRETLLIWSVNKYQTMLANYCSSEQMCQTQNVQNAKFTHVKCTKRKMYTRKMYKTQNPPTQNELNAKCIHAKRSWTLRNQMYCLAEQIITDCLPKRCVYCDRLFCDTYYIQLL